MSSAVKELCMQSQFAENQKFSMQGPFTTIRFLDDSMSIFLGQDPAPEDINVFNVWSHTVFELENIAEGFRYLALDYLPDCYKVGSRDRIIGPTVSLWPSLRFQLGGTTFYGSVRTPRRSNRRVIDLDALFERRASVATFEAKEVLVYSDWFYELAQELAKRFISTDVLE